MADNATVAPNAPNSQLDMSVTPAPAPSVPAPNVPAAPAPDLSGLAAPAAQPNLATAVQGSMAPYEEASQAATQKAAQIANTPVATPASGHQRLLSMVQGLALGLSSFGTAIATHGREGGAAEVAQVQGEQQTQRLQQQEFAQQQKNTAIQNQLTIADTNQKQAQNIFMLATLPEDLQLKDLQLQSGQAELATNEASFRASHYGMSPTDFNAMLNGTGTGGAGANANASVMRTQISQEVQAAIQNPEVGPNDPYVKQMQTVLADPNASPKDVYMAATNLTHQVQMKHDVTAAQTASVTALPKDEQGAAAQLAAAKDSGDPTRIQKAQQVYDAVHKSVQDERQFASNLQEANQKANKQITMQNTIAEKGLDEIDKLWTDPQHGFTQTRAQIDATKNAATQAKNGSELAANLEPVMTALGVNSFAGVHRINQTEINNAGSTVGSLYRRINAALDRAGAGAIPADTLKEVNGIMDALIQTKYQASLDATRQIAANAGLPQQNIFVSDPNNYSQMVSLDKVGSTNTPSRVQQSSLKDTTIPTYAVPRS